MKIINALIFQSKIKKVLEKYNEIWDKIKYLFDKKTDSELCIMINT